MTLYRLVRCRRCGSDYRAATPEEARSELCDRCGAMLAGLLVFAALLCVAVTAILLLT